MTAKNNKIISIQFSSEKPNRAGWYFYRKDKRYKRPAGWKFVEVIEDGNRLWMRSNKHKGCSFRVDICRGQFSKTVFVI